jgi:hypothetical protein
MNASFDLEVARRLPLADAALRLLQYATDDEFLDGVFQRHRGRSYTKTIRFPQLVQLVGDALLGHRGSAHQTFRQAQQDDRLEASVQAAYRKLGKVPLSLSLGFFAETADRLREVAPAAAAHPAPAALAEFRLLAFDGKKLKYVAKRLKPLRGLKGNVFGGKLLVVQDLVTQHAVAAQADADGESADNPLVPDAVARVRALPDSRPRLWVGDRAFCDFKILNRLATAPDHFVVRFNTACGFHPDSSVKPRTGTDADGRPYHDEVGWLGKAGHPHRVRVRKITVTRPNDEPFVIVTSLEDAERYPASDLLTLYRRRWGIETMFQQVVQTFDLRHLIGGTPQATVFQAMICLLLYNITLVIRDYVVPAAAKKSSDISMQLLFDDLVRDLTGWVEVLGVDSTLELLRATRAVTIAELRRHLEQTLATVWTDRWTKAPTHKRPPTRRPRAYICGGHSSVDKILRGAHKEIPFKPKKRNQSDDPPPFETKKDV